jgi:outer membrane lipoprotein SlyB
MKQFTFRGAAVVAVAAVALVAGGCATPVPGPYYYPAGAPRAQSVEMGVVEAVRPLQFQGPDTGVGALSGAALGGWAGSGIGAGSGNAAAIVGGVILGSIIGNAVEREASKRSALELTVRLDAGRTIAAVQADAGEGFRPGDRVRVVSDGYRTRISY